jgi:hypothetical protein
MEKQIDPLPQIRRPASRRRRIRNDGAAAARIGFRRRTSRQGPRYRLSGPLRRKRACRVGGLRSSYGEQLAELPTTSRDHRERSAPTNGRVVTYLITFACYGAHLHGDESGSIDRLRNLPGSRVISADAGRVALERRLMNLPPYSLDQPRRHAVLAALLERAHGRGWSVFAAHVRTNNVHVIIDAEASSERVMNDLKSYASRQLNAIGFDTRDRKRWARHGSTRWLRNRKNVEAAIAYVVEKQGDPMAVYVSDSLRR